MNWRAGILVIVSAAGFLGLVFWLSSHSPPTPKFQGRSLDAWLGDLSPGSPQRMARAATALQQMEPSPAPILVQRLRANDSPFRQIEERLHLPGLPPSAYKLRGQAMMGLRALGPAAKPVIPDLAKLIWDPQMGQGAISLLAALGPESAPYLLAALTNAPAATNARVQIRTRQIRERLLVAVGMAGTNSPAAVPILLADLQSADSMTRITAMRSLARVRVAPAQARAAVFQMLGDPDNTVRRNAAESLTGWDRPGWRLRLGRRASDYDPIAAFDNSQPIDASLSEALISMAEHDAVYNARETAVACLLVVDPKGALDAFLNGLQSSDIEVRRNCAWDFMQFKKGGRPAVPALIQCLNDPDAKLQQNAAVALREIGGQPEKAVPALMAKMRDADPKGRVIFAIALSGFGEAAKPVVPQLIDMLTNNPSEFDAEGLFNALYRIDPAAADRLQAEETVKQEAAETNGITK